MAWLLVQAAVKSFAIKIVFYYASCGNTEVPSVKWVFLQNQLCFKFFMLQKFGDLNWEKRTFHHCSWYYWLPVYSDNVCLVVWLFFFFAEDVSSFSLVIPHRCFMGNSVVFTDNVEMVAVWLPCWNMDPVLQQSVGTWGTALSPSCVWGLMFTRLFEFWRILVLSCKK